MASTRDLEIVAAGHTCLDLIPAFTINGSVDKLTDILVPGRMINMGPCVVVGGGPVTNAGVSIRRLGVKTELIGKIGNDDFGRQILSWYEEHEGHFQGIKTVDGESTSYTIAICIPGIDRFYLHHCGANDTFGYDDMTFDLVARAKLMLFGYPPWMRKLYEDTGRELTRILGRTKDLGTTTALDLSLPDVNSRAGQVDWVAILRDWVPLTDIMMPSAEEIFYFLYKKEFLAKKAKLGPKESVLDHLSVTEISTLGKDLTSMGAAIAMIKCGHRGLYVRTAGTARLRRMGAASCTDLDNWADRELWFPVYQEEKFVGALGSGRLGDRRIPVRLRVEPQHRILPAIRERRGKHECHRSGRAHLEQGVRRPDATHQVRVEDEGPEDRGAWLEARAWILGGARQSREVGIIDEGETGDGKWQRRARRRGTPSSARSWRRMSLAEKIGQVLTFTRRGAMLTPSGIEQITRLECGGLCLEPYAVETCKNLYWGNSQIDQSFKKPEDYFSISNTYFAGKAFGISITPEDYTKDLNRLQKIAMSRPSGIPLHMTIDFEGDFKNDYMAGGIRQFPPPMGMAAIGDTKLTYKIGLTIGKQLSAIGVTQMYSPVCDVNINPKNPEIGVRSFSDDPEICAKHAVALLRGLQDGGIAATAKHFPGRGDSATDAHDVLDVIRADKQRMHDVELYPFKAAIAAGVKAIMTGAFGVPRVRREVPDDACRSESSRVCCGRSWVSTGVIVSDAIGMAAILKKWPLPRACALALKAGCDTILLKADDESRSQCFFGIKQAVESGELSEERLDEAVTRLLRMKYDQGLFETAGKKDPKKAQAYAMSKPVVDLSWDVAKKALIVMRDGAGMLPLKKDKRMLIIEQRIPYEFVGKDPYMHQHMFGEAMVEHSANAILVDTDFAATEEEMEECLQLAKAGGSGGDDQLLRPNRQDGKQPSAGQEAEGGRAQGRGRHELPVRRGDDGRGGRGGLQLQRNARIRSGPRSTCCSAR